MQLIDTPTTQQNTSARDFWDQLMQKHPGVNFVLSVIGSVVEFFTGGHIVVWIGRKVVMFAGRTAETALLFAAIWITGIYAAPDFMRSISFGMADTFTNMAKLSFTILPEIVLFSAIIVCVIHWYHAFTFKKWSEGVWAGLYTLPTIVFFGMAIYTFCTVILSPEHQLHAATGWALVLRSVTSWFYCLVGLVHAGLKRVLPQIAITHAQMNNPAPATQASANTANEEDEQQQTAQPVQASDLAQLVQAMQEMNAQNLAAMQRMNDESMSRFSHVTVELVRETIERTAATVALPSASQPALPEARQSVEVEQEAVAEALQYENEGMEVLDITVRGEQKNDVQGEHEARDYSAHIEALYQANHDITVTEIVDHLGCSRSTANKWLKRVKPVTA